MRNRFLAILLFVLLPLMAMASDAFDYTSFGKIPVAHEGRIKPLSRYAGLLFKNVTGDYPATENQGTAWLAAVLFDPSGAVNAPQFNVANKQVVYALGLPQAAEYYSFDDINTAFLKKKELLSKLQKAQNPTKDERDLLTLYIHASAFEQTKDALTQSLPLLMGGDAQNPMTFVELPRKHRLHKVLADKGKANVLLTVIPQNDTWLSPWQSALSPQPSALLGNWKNVAVAYIKQDANAWNTETQKLADSTLQASTDITLSSRLMIERLYQSVDPYFYSFVLYIFAFLTSLSPARKKPVATYALLSAGIALHGLGLLARMIILQRPPVSTLYESVLFVGFLATVLFLLFAYKQKRDSFLSLSALIGIGFYLVALALTEDQDDLKVLEAVLNTRFWLATHVIAITTGYALCALTALMAHAYLAAKAFDKRIFFATNEFATRIYQLSAWSLLFVAGGTLLGGIWADQSWGRFWGWDPKENSALLIVLWLTWLLHAKLSKRFHMHHFIVGAALLSIVVACSWLGINLLGIGLHSYGFTSGLAKGFAAFCVGDIMLLAFLWMKGRKHGTLATL